MDDERNPAPFSVPPNLEPSLARVRNYWLGLRRGQADIPFTDDVSLSALSLAGVDLLLVDVFERPSRFRIAIAEPGIAARYGQAVEGIFADEIVPQAPLDYFRSQCSACAEGRAPTYYRSARPSPYARLLLPLWGDGHINALLGAVVCDAS
jgi:hypothetical protein